MKIAGMLGTLAAVALVAAAGCDRAPTGSRAADKAAPGGGPQLDYGTTASVAVHCPTNIENSQSGQCVAFGYDASGRFTGSSGASWSTSTSSLISVGSGGLATAASSGTGTATVSATLGGITGSTSIAIRSSAALAVSITGSDLIKSQTYCTWAASPSGGSGSYSYSWSATSPAVGTAAGGEWIGKSASNFTLSVTVSDGYVTATASKSITISASGNCTV